MSNIKVFMCSFITFLVLNPFAFQMAPRHSVNTRISLQVNTLNNVGEYQIPLGVFVGLVSLIPASIPLDRLLQRGYSRISNIANYRIKDETGDIFTYIARPIGSPRGGYKRPVVILLHQFFGLRKRDTELCDELARLGYLAVAPDCFQGKTTSLIPRAISFVTSAAYNDDWVLPLRDLRRIISYLEKECGTWADMENIVVAGFCFGGGLALRYSENYPNNIKGCAVFYGKPLKKVTNLRCELYGVYGAKDRQFPPAMVDDFESELRAHRSSIGRANSIEIRRYPTKAHAFVENLACIKRGGDAGDAWDGFLSFLQRVFATNSEDKVWGQSFIGQDVCGSKLNNDPFNEIDNKSESWEAMTQRIEAVAQRSRAENSFFLSFNDLRNQSSSV